MHDKEAEAVVVTTFAHFDVPLGDEAKASWVNGLAATPDLNLEEAMAAVEQLTTTWKPSGGRRIPTLAELAEVIRLRRRARERTVNAGASSWQRRQVCVECHGVGFVDRTAEVAERDGKLLSSMAVVPCVYCGMSGKGTELEPEPTPRDKAKPMLAKLRAAIAEGVVRHIDDLVPPEEHNVRPDGRCDHPGCRHHVGIKAETSAGF